MWLVQDDGCRAEKCICLYDFNWPDSLIHSVFDNVRSNINPSSVALQSTLHNILTFLIMNSFFRSQCKLQADRACARNFGRDQNSN